MRRVRRHEEQRQPRQAEHAEAQRAAVERHVLHPRGGREHEERHRHRQHTARSQQLRDHREAERRNDRTVRQQLEERLPRHRGRPRRAPEPRHRRRPGRSHATSATIPDRDSSRSHPIHAASPQIAQTTAAGTSTESSTDSSRVELTSRGVLSESGMGASSPGSWHLQGGSATHRSQEIPPDDARNAGARALVERAALGGPARHLQIVDPSPQTKRHDRRRQGHQRRRVDRPTPIESHGYEPAVRWTRRGANPP